MEIDNDTMQEIKRVILFYFIEFKNEVGDTQVALELTKEAMLTYRTLLIKEDRKHGEEPITEKQLSYLMAMAHEDFRVNQIITEYIRGLGKKHPRELTKKEASNLIDKIKEKIS